ASMLARSVSVGCETTNNPGGFIVVGSALKLYQRSDLLVRRVARSSTNLFRQPLICAATFFGEGAPIATRFASEWRMSKIFITSISKSDEKDCIVESGI